MTRTVQAPDRQTADRGRGSRPRPLVRRDRGGEHDGTQTHSLDSRNFARRVVRPRRATRISRHTTTCAARDSCPCDADDGRILTLTVRLPGNWAVLTGQEVISLLWMGALLVVTWPLFAAPSGTPAVSTVAHVAGMLAGYGVLVLIVLVSRLPALERDVGADVLTRWHARTARLVLGLVVLHAGAATLAWMHSRNETSAVSVWHVLTLPWLPAATVGTLLMIFVALASVRQARRALGQERWHGLHLLMYAAVALGFGHQLAGPDLVGHRWLQIGWALAYTHVFALVIRHRVLSPVRQAARHRMRVAAVHDEGPGVVSIHVEGQHLDELQAQPGQFFRWRFLTPDHWWNAHPFSLSAPPTKKALRLTVKALGDGTKNLQNLAVGTWVIAEGPYGAITSARRTRRDVLLIAGGVGITPMRALFETIPLSRGADLVLLYRARTADELLFRAELDEIAARRNARVIYLLGKDRSVLSAGALRRTIPNIARRDVYMCGPPALTAAVRSALLTAGLSATHLHEERFSF
jgi:predicted ferric reductase